VDQHRVFKEFQVGGACVFAHQVKENLFEDWFMHQVSTMVFQSF